MKDNFSTSSDQYAKYRPTYPVEFYEFLKTLVSERSHAWDCGTGNGQVASELAKIFEKVSATDISKAQLDHAIQLKNIEYSVQAAEQTNFPDHAFDLIVVAQALHWFDFTRFYEEVNRTGKKGSLIIAMGYGRLEVKPEIDKIISDFYHQIIGPYWDAERKYIDENYKTIPFPFQEVDCPQFINSLNWSFDHLIGYLNTWSAVKHFRTQQGYNPINQIHESLKSAWGEDSIKEVRFPLLLRVGRID